MILHKNHVKLSNIGLLFNQMVLQKVIFYFILCFLIGPKFHFQNSYDHTVLLSWPSHTNKVICYTKMYHSYKFGIKVIEIFIPFDSFTDTIRKKTESVIFLRGLIMSPKFTKFLYPDNFLVTQSICTNRKSPM
jgi:uncharacterized membrane protein